MDILLDVRNLKVYYKSVLGDFKVVDGVSFSIKRGEVFGIAGESGCGKSTMVEGIMKLVRPPGYIPCGEVLFNNMDLLGMKEEELQKIRWRKLSYIPQGSMNSLNPILRVEEQIVDGCVDHGMDGKKAREMVDSLLKIVGLPSDVAKMYPHELSGGMKQRVCIAMAISLNPELIVADEPTTALDVSVQKAILQSLLDFKSKGITIAIVSHNMAVHAEVADRIAVMYAGKILEIANVHKIFDEPLNPYVRALVSCIPSLDGKKSTGIPGQAPSPLEWPKGCRFHPRCALAISRCKYEEPSLCEVNKGHWVACHIA